jgi:hypothetical protein
MVEAPASAGKHARTSGDHRGNSPRVASAGNETSPSRTIPCRCFARFTAHCARALSNGRCIARRSMIEGSKENQAKPVGMYGVWLDA